MMMSPRALLVVGVTGVTFLLASGLSSAAPRSATAVLPSTANAMDVGGGHTCALMTNATVECWGDNETGQLGDGTYTVQTAPVRVADVTDVKAVFGGDSHTCAVTRDGAAHCWGANGFGQLGDGTTATRPKPVAVIGLSSPVIQIAAGFGFTCALTTDGVFCWGDNSSGELGDGQECGYGYCQVPVGVPSLANGVQSLSAGIGHVCALLSDGSVKCWGWNGNGQLGDGTTADRNVPTNVSGLSSGVAEIATGGYHTCARMTSGGVKCWGKNVRGQLGDGTGDDRHTPVDVKQLNATVASLTGGYNFTCAVTTTHGAKCWGRNLNGELGEGKHQCPTLCMHPVDVGGLSKGVLTVAAGGGHACAFTEAHGVKCWGWNDRGQVGDGTKDDRFSPVDVTGLQGWKCSVPNVRTKMLAVAKSKIRQAHCTVGRVTKKRSRIKDKGHVVSQAPAAGAKLAYGSRVNIVVGRGRTR